MDDPYQILGVERSASAEEARKAYRKLSKEWHPDKHKGDKAAEEKYKKINQAYEILSDPKKKQMYDQFGSADGPQFSGGGGNPFGGGFGGFEGMGDIFENFFGGQQRRSRSEGNDMEVAVTVTMAEAYHGGAKTIRIKALVPCSVCGGSGITVGSSMEDCSECGGAGTVTRTVQSFFGAIRQSMPCSRCQGAGRIPKNPCSSCRGEGRVGESRDVQVNIPAGIADGQTLRLRGQGEAGRQNAAAGDLFVHMRVTPDPRFAREGDDLSMQTTITASQAVLGTDVHLETLGGPVTLKVPAGTQPGQVLRLKGKGMPVLNTSRTGDLFIHVYVALPKKLSKKEKGLWEELDKF